MDRLKGLTDKDCPNACRSGHCVISDGPICAHPKKGSHMHAHADKEIVHKAKEMLGHQQMRR